MIGMRDRWGISLVVVGMGLSACNESATRSISPDNTVGAIASFVIATPGAGSENVLSAHLTFTISGADSVRAVYKDANGVTGSTPFRTSGTVADTVLILGLRPSTTYSAYIEGDRNGVASRSEPVTFQTAALPAAVASFGLRQISGVGSRYAAIGLNVDGVGYATLFDSAGRVAWYADLTGFNLPVSNVVQQPNGNITAFLGGTAGWTPVDGYYVEIAPDGRVEHTFRAPAGYYTDNHELQLTGSGSSLRAHYFTYDVRTVDLSASGGSSTAQVTGHQLVRTDPSGTIQFTWSAWDHFALSEKVGEAQGAALAGTDFDHPNSLSFDGQGNYIASWRDLNQVMAIDPQSGAVLWRIGGVRGEYTFVGDPQNGFSKQHYVRILPNGHLILYDNGNDLAVPETRAVEYKLDRVAKTATMVWEFKHSPAIWTQFVGNVNRLSNGNTWIGFAGAGRVVEASATGQTLWEAQVTIAGADASGYRIIPVRSLYGYVAP
jgi:hypothetical protein